MTYVGSKSSVIDEILAKFPNDIETYREPFIGGGLY